MKFFSVLFSAVVAFVFSVVTGALTTALATGDGNIHKDLVVAIDKVDINESGMDHLYAGNEGEDENEDEADTNGEEGEAEEHRRSAIYLAQATPSEDFARRDGDLSGQAIDGNQNEVTDNRMPASEDEPVATEEKPSRWGFYFEIWQEGVMSFKDRSLAEFYLRPQYKLTDDLTVGFSVIIRSLWAFWDTDDASPNETEVHDPYILFSYSGFNLGPTSVFGYARVYLPLSEQSRRRGQIFRLRIKPYITLPIYKKINLVGRLETNYYPHTVDSYVEMDENPPYTCTSEFTCPGYNTHWTIDPMLGFNGRIYGPWSFESIHGVRIQRNFSNANAVAAGSASEPNKINQFSWFHESGLMFDIPNTPVTLMAGFGQIGPEVRESSFLKSLPIVSYFTNPDDAFWVLNMWMTF